MIEIEGTPRLQQQLVRHDLDFNTLFILFFY